MTEVDWEDLRHFTMLAETLNLSRAAAGLGTSQVTVMRRVRALERSLGATLFLRQRDGHRLTATGAEFLRATREAAQLIHDGASKVRARDRRAGGRVRIVTTELAANWLLLPALPSFQAANPDIVLEIDASPDALRLTDDAETIALRFRRPQNGPLRIRKVGDISFSLYRSIRHGEAMRRYIGWAGSFADIGIAGWLRQLHGDVPPALMLTTFEGHLKAAREGIGAAALPDFIGRADAMLAPVEVEGPPFALNAWLVVPEQIAALAKVRCVAKFIEAAVARGTGRS